MKIRPSKRIAESLLFIGTLLAAALNSRAAVIYSGVVDIPIPTTFSGVYLDLANGVTAPGGESSSVTQDSYTVGYTEPGSWDVNFFFGGIGIVYSPTFQPFVDDMVGNHSQILNVAAGTVIAAEAATRTLAAAAYGGSGHSNGSPGTSHFDTPTVDLDPAYSAFTPGAQGYIAFVLNPGGSARYGWMSVTLTNNGTPGVIHEWAFSDSSSFQVSQIPEPYAALLGSFGLFILLRRWRA